MALDQQPSPLPVEIQKEIIDILGEEAAFLSKDRFELDPDGFKGLCNISLVCRAWRPMALRHIFRRVRLTTGWRKVKTCRANGRRGRLDCLLALIQHNLNIADCVQIVYLHFPSPTADEQHALMEEISEYIAPITSLTIDFEYIRPSAKGDWSLQSYPHLLTAFHNLTRTPEFRELHLISGRAHTSFLEAVENLETLDLSHSSDGLVVDHEVSSDLSRPRKLIMKDSPEAFIAEAEGNPDIRGLFSNVKELATLGADIAKQYRWGPLLDLGNLMSLRLHCYASLYRGGWGDQLFTFFRNHIPWESFTQLNSLSLSISSSYAPRLGADDPNDVSDLIFTGTSRLPRLSSLQINFCLGEDLVDDRHDIPRFIHMLYQRSLDRTFADHSSFPALKTFRTEIHIISSIWDEISLKSLIRRVKKELPSVFGPGGRQELHGWKAVVRAKVEQYIDPSTYPEPDELRSDSDDEKDEDELEDEYDEKIARWGTAETDSLTDTSSLDLDSESSDFE